MTASRIMTALVVVAGSLLSFDVPAQEATDPASRQVSLKKGESNHFLRRFTHRIGRKGCQCPGEQRLRSSCPCRSKGQRC